MAKKPGLSAALQINDAKEDEPAAQEAPAGRTDRDDAVNIAAWFPLAVKLELNEIAIEQSRSLNRKVTLREVMAEAYNDLFKKYDRPELAPTKKRRRTR